MNKQQSMLAYPLFNIRKYNQFYIKNPIDSDNTVILYYIISFLFILFSILYLFFIYLLLFACQSWRGNHWQ